MRQQNSGGCLTAFAVGFSRMFLIFTWLARPVLFNSVFGGSWIIPCLGIMILPFTTLMYAILVTNGPGNRRLAWTGCGCSLRWPLTSPAQELLRLPTVTGSRRAIRALCLLSPPPLRRLPPNPNSISFGFQKVISPECRDSASPLKPGGEAGNLVGLVFHG